MRYVFKKPFYIFIISIIDVLGYAFFLPAKLFKKTVPQNPKNILIVRPDHIGDFVCSSPVFRNLKEKFPDAKITVLINSVSKDLAFRNPYIDKVISFSPFHLNRTESSNSLNALARIIKDIKAFNFDLGIELRGDFLSILLMWIGGVKYRIGYGITGGGFLLNKVCKYNKSIHTIDRNLILLEELGITPGHRSPEVYFNEKDKHEVERLLQSIAGAGDNRLVVMHPFSGASAKEWPRTNFCRLINWLKKNGYDILLVGSGKDNGYFGDVIDMRGKLNLPQLAYLIKRAGFFIGLDSGPANIAAALNIKSMVICSGTNIPQLWIPKSANLIFIYKDTECKPCEKKICPDSRHKCMAEIGVEDIISQIKE